VKNLGNGFYQQRFGEAWGARDETMAAGEERDEQLFDDFVLADDHLAQFSPYPGPAGQELVDGFFFRGDGGGGV
jgi:hypothetical protein